jgi:hypothetical protein
METVLSISTQHEDHAGETVGGALAHIFSSPNIQVPAWTRKVTSEFISKGDIF